MPRYFFDIQDGSYTRDDVGVECTDLQSVAMEAKKLLPTVARDEVPKGGEHRAVTVLVTDEDGRAVYSAALTYTGLWLLR
ncbi:hypothetical protein [Methylobacterium sp. WL6]|uniref:DUF6894 family protein n=1 Tax=Methylobacterium sp. WL6 TaxID=2603901 RepID=UPI0011C8395E|nr:hypothetical protein [Methylobacterium sp. WL6]TXN72830.1 hypothetical protein FV230_03385 [Methylobacterium sp. WL6]